MLNIPVFHGTNKLSSEISEENNEQGGKVPNTSGQNRNFGDLYQLQEQLGSGISGTVYKCRHIGTGMEYAVKVIDMRPLRFSPNFDTKRLMNEVEVLKNIDHQSVIKLIEFFVEKEESLLLVMEYAPGKELFDCILNQPNGHYSEEKAKPIVLQITNALQYLHSSNIIHRDIKPENILVLENEPADPVIKVLDFGLSKQIQSGLSLPKTFVGTPCYLAPEVEKSKYDRKPYGKEVDYWSLGAVLYVMLVARFPEFTTGEDGKKQVLFREALWGSVSANAKDLISSLLLEDPANRITSEGILSHPWLSPLSQSNTCAIEHENNTCQKEPSSSNRLMVLGNMQIVRSESAEQSDTKLPRSWASMMESQQSNHSVAMSPQESYESEWLGGGKRPATEAQSSINEKESLPAPPSPTVSQPAQNIPTTKNTSESGPIVTTPSNDNNMQIIPIPNQRVFTNEQENRLAAFTNVGPLIQINRDISVMFRNILHAYIDHPHLASQLREGALLCRNQMRENNSLLRKLERVAAGVLDIFSDLELAVEENEPELAQSFFSSIRKWMDELSTNIKAIQTQQKEVTQQVHQLMEKTVQVGLQENDLSFENINNAESSSYRPYESMMAVDEVSAKVSSEVREVSESGELKEEVLLDLFLPNIEKIQHTVRQNQHIQPTSSSLALNPLNSAKENAVEKEDQEQFIKNLVFQMLQDLHRIDEVLENLATFWGNTKVIMDVLLVKADHVQNFIRYVSKPKIFERFVKRLQEYELFWKTIQNMCSSLLLQQGPANSAYSFLDSISPNQPSNQHAIL
mmetsp:Transcript_33982/g.44864  ORF Transcript_33982/g.44864 Transcript_33982/m.44864 type:complete len:799 (+) Transcript_33982:93-2489(+)